MNSNSNILNIYKKVIKSGDLQKNPHEIIKLVLTELSRTMKMISDDIEKKKVFVLKEGSSDLINIQKSISKNVSRSLTTIYSLQTSLDFDKGGKIATGLFQIYEYCRLQIIKGFSKFGGYRGNGSATEGFYQPLGFSPSLVIVKKTSATAAWYMWNGVYQGYNPKNNALFPYHTSQQNTTERIELLSNGFKFYHSDSDHNASSTDFIYYAWASNPIVGSNGTAGVAK